MYPPPAPYNWLNAKEVIYFKEIIKGVKSLKKFFLLGFLGAPLRTQRTGLWLMYDDLTDVIRVTVSTGEQRNSRLRGTEEQWAQRNRGTVGTEAQRHSGHRGTVGTEEQWAQRNRGTVSTGEQ